MNKYELYKGTDMIGIVHAETEAEALKACSVATSAVLVSEQDETRER